ncbi:MAG: S41 family peptidase [Prevotella sp.]|nr:S41 family peptidase [Prevotella sp.]MBR4521925.1 S41 family peptidase [Prevotella sp.]
MKQRYMPLLMALSAVIGILIGSFYANHFSSNRLSIINSGTNKLNNLLHIINDQYVDTVNIGNLVETAIPQILSELDPHSVYIPASEAQIVSDDLKGEFYGIGIEFVIREDTIHVQNVIDGGPAQRAGVIAGDKIVTIDGKPYVGDTINSEGAMRRLKGPDKTKVRVGIKRYGSSKPLSVEITRGKITTKSILATYMLDDKTGYIRVKNFGEHTYEEFLAALAELQQQRFSNLVIDLRDNTGGYLEAAVQMANEFLPKDRLIVYTQGRRSQRQDYKSDGRGSYQDFPLVVLINEISASASEIFAGAMQDNDRGTIIGRRSYGKGLVQQQIAFADGSMIRLTVARYYTPSGRCIQKPYAKGDTKDYQQDIINRYENGEFFSKDSIKHEGPEYHTISGKPVYGGGGITPDIFVAEDTTNITSYYREASMTGLIMQFAFTYTDDNRLKLNNFKEMQALADYLVKQHTVDKFADYASKRGLQRRNLMIEKSHKLLETYINSRIIYNILNEQAWVEYLNQDDKAIEEALRFFQQQKKSNTTQTK